MILNREQILAANDVKTKVWKFQNGSVRSLCAA